MSHAGTVITVEGIQYVTEPDGEMARPCEEACVFRSSEGCELPGAVERAAGLDCITGDHHYKWR